MKYKNIREEELKNKVGADWFTHFDTTEIIGNIDFTVFPQQDNLFGRIPLLWAEAKTGNFDTATMFVQLILTIGKARTFDKTLPPAFLGAFDFKKMAFVPYISVQDIFYLNDFMMGTLKPEAPLTTTLFENETKIGIYNNKPLVFSDSAKAVFNAGRNLWLYYHQHQHANVNASLYDIREYFQGRNDKGRMNARSTDLKYTELIAQLRVNLTILANQIKPKVYEYGFLKE